MIRVLCNWSPVFNQGVWDAGNKKPHRLIGSEVSEISFVNQNPTAALLSSSAFTSSRMFKFRITGQNVLFVRTRVNGILDAVLECEFCRRGVTVATTR